MAVALAIFGVALAAFCVWLTVRIVSRRERWAKWTLAALVGLPVLYALSTGPVVWALMQNRLPGAIVGIAESFVEPLGILMYEGPEFISIPILWWWSSWGWQE